MSSHPNMSDQPGQLPPPPSFSHAQGNLYGPAPFDGAQIHQDRSSPGLILAAVVLGLALIAVCVKLLLPSEDPVPDNTQAAPAMAIPENARNASGDGWTMKVSPKWVDLKIPKVKEDAAWRTDDARSFFGLVVVMADPQPSGISIDDYMDTSVLTLQQDDPTVSIISDDIYQAPDHEYGRVEYTAKDDGTDVRNVIYFSANEGGFITAVYGTRATRFEDAAPKVEPFLSTLQDR